MITANDDDGHVAAAAKLEQLLGLLHQYRAQLDAVEELGDRMSRKRLRLLISSQHDLIRRHCSVSGLQRPDDVPETDGGE